MRDVEEKRNENNEKEKENEQMEKHMVNSRTPGPHPTHASPSWHCPFFTPADAICQAALRPRTPPRRVRANACGGGDHEDCTTFLVRLLNRPGR